MVKRHYLLDITRGLTSLAVVIWHYQHFFFQWPGKEPSNFEQTRQPLYDILYPFYQQSPIRMALFFALSGFVIFFAYGDKIRERSMGAAQFIAMRLTRLYPLHLATLALVALLQILCRKLYGAPFVYQCNDAYHFMLNLFSVVGWLPSNKVCRSFNAPVWSLSVEVLLYIAFFVFILLMPADRIGRIAAAFGLLCMGAALTRFGIRPLGEPFLCFFAGGLTYLTWRSISQTTGGRRIAAFAASLLVCVSAAVFAYNPAQRLTTDIVLLPSFILSLALLQGFMPHIGKKLKWIGDISFSIYMIHFPIQLVIVMIAVNFTEPAVFYNPLALLLYLTIVVVCAALVHRWFEKPARLYLRRITLPVAVGGAIRPGADAVTMTGVP